MSMNCSTNQKSSKEFTRKIKVSNLPGYDSSLLFMTKVFKMICTLKKALRPRIFVKYFSCSLIKTCHQRKLRQTKGLLSNFEW